MAGITQPRTGAVEWGGMIGCPIRCRLFLCALARIRPSDDLLDAAAWIVELQNVAKRN